MTEIELKKLETDIKLAEAQIDKTRSEIDATTKRPFGHYGVEALKVLAAGIIGIGGVITAINGYQLKEIEKAQLSLDVRELKDQKTQLENEAKTKLAHSNQQVAEARSEALTAQKALDAAAKQPAEAPQIISSATQQIADTRNKQLAELKSKGPPFGYRISPDAVEIYTNYNGKRIWVKDAKGITGELGVPVEPLGALIEVDPSHVYDAGVIRPK